MDAHKDGLVLFPFAFYQGYVLKPIGFLLEGDEAEVSPLGGHINLFATLYERLLTQAVLYKVAYADDF